MVWFPTVDAENEAKNITGEHDDGKPVPYWMTIARAMLAKGIAGEPSCRFEINASLLFIAQTTE